MSNSADETQMSRINVELPNLASALCQLSADTRSRTLLRKEKVNHEENCLDRRHSSHP